MLFWSTVSPAFLSVPGAATKFINANFAADLAANDLISVSALPFVFGKDCEVVAASAELLAVAFLLALPCRTVSVALVASWVLVLFWSTVAANFAADELISVSALPCVFGADCKVVAASVELLAVAVLLALVCWTFSFALVACWVLVCSAVVNTAAELLSALSVVAAFTEWFVRLIPKMVTPNNTEAIPTLSLRIL